MSEISFFKLKLLNIIFLLIGAYNCIQTVLLNPGISEEVFKKYVTIENNENKQSINNSNI